MTGRSSGHPLNSGNLLRHKEYKGLLASSGPFLVRCETIPLTFGPQGYRHGAVAHKTDKTYLLQSVNSDDTNV
jgi:hypothetical protein